MEFQQLLIVCALDELVVCADHAGIMGHSREDGLNLNLLTN
jgi:hypothetical protein